MNRKKLSTLYRGRTEISNFFITFMMKNMLPKSYSTNCCTMKNWPYEFGKSTQKVTHLVQMLLFMLFLPQMIQFVCDILSSILIFCCHHFLDAFIFGFIFMSCDSGTVRHVWMCLCVRMCQSLRKCTYCARIWYPKKTLFLFLPLARRIVKFRMCSQWIYGLKHKAKQKQAERTMKFASLCSCCFLFGSYCHFLLVHIEPFQVFLCSLPSTDVKRHTASSSFSFASSVVYILYASYRLKKFFSFRLYNIYAWELWTCARHFPSHMGAYMCMCVLVCTVTLPRFFVHFGVIRFAALSSSRMFFFFAHFVQCSFFI